MSVRGINVIYAGMNTAYIRPDIENNVNGW
ncbi:hypothetical protein HMPREF9240_01250 [Winkia neuii BV029A5]|uniref:Uncharacterized protein n=1 Tax=Winkia neuii BV029A5 TaxID=888439 RepID=K0YTF6_9ACTO|nr:hypothetical protein HMPREF9240_01250 [Winkia neuii BV029A5]